MSDMKELELKTTKYNLTVAMCWFAVITGLLGLIVRVVFVADDYLWFSIFGVIAGALGITFGPDLRTIETKTVKLQLANPKK